MVKFSTTLQIEIDVPTDIQKYIKEHPGSKLGLCEIITEDMVKVIKDNVQAKKGLAVKGNTIIRDFQVLDPMKLLLNPKEGEDHG